MNVDRAEADAVAERAATAQDTAVVRVEKLVKCFGSNRVLDGIDLIDQPLGRHPIEQLEVVRSRHDDVDRPSVAS